MGQRPIRQGLIRTTKQASKIINFIPYLPGIVNIPEIRQRYRLNRRNQFAKVVIDLKLPKGLSEISIKNLIGFRQNYREELGLL